MAITINICEQHVAEGLRDIEQELSKRPGGIILDFSNVQRLDANGVLALQNLAATPDAAPLKVVLTGLAPGIYRVLKSLKLSSKFSYLDETEPRLEVEGGNEQRQHG
jgi:anti-anti-sigma regulatory factor